MNRGRRLLSVTLGILIFTGLALPLSFAGDDWQPINPAELQMTSEPAAPGAMAVYLFRQVDRDDVAYHENNYARIKILTEEGRKYANIELPYFKEAGNIRGIKARTIRPDGSVVNFEGKAYDTTVVKAKGVKFLAKTFTMPDVQVGSIIEYRYIYEWNPGVVYDSHWILSEDLFTKHAKFSLKPSSAFGLRWAWPVGLPAGTAVPTKESGGIIRLETNNIPAFQTEDYMPPVNELKFRVDFVYTDNTEKDLDKFWRAEGKKFYHQVENFASRSRTSDQAVAEIVSPSDPPEVKLQKIYDRVQQIRNASFEKEKSDQEMKRDKLKDINNAGDVWKHGYGDGRQITWLFLALARSAGLEAYPVLVSRRSDYFFNDKIQDSSELNDNVVVVRLDGKDIYCDPGTPYAPLGLLPWPETGTKGLRLDKDGGTWLSTPLPMSSATRIERKADLKLTNEGSLKGKLTVTFVGLEALWRRLEERNDDDTDRKRFLEDEIKQYIPVGIEIELTNKPDWKSSTQALVAEYDVNIPGWASGAGRRALLPVGLFGSEEKHVFEHGNRVHAIYFHFPSEKIDDVTIAIPDGWKVTSIPEPQKRDMGPCSYSLTAENKSESLHFKRDIRMDILLLDMKYYQALRNFYQVVRTGDEQQVVLQPGAASASD